MLQKLVTFVYIFIRYVLSSAILVGILLFCGSGIYTNLVEEEGELEAVFFGGGFFLTLGVLITIWSPEKGFKIFKSIGNYALLFGFIFIFSLLVLGCFFFCTCLRSSRER